MTDNTSLYAGNYRGAILPVTCILNEGAPTVGTSYDQAGLSQKTLTWADELYEGDIIAIANDSDITYVATEGSPVVERPQNGETLVLGRIVSTPKLEKFPAASADANTLAERLAGGYFRTANIEFFGVTQVLKAEVMCDGSNPTVPGVGVTIKFNITSGGVKHTLCFDSAASGGVGVIPFHYVPAGTNGDLYNCLVGLTGFLIAVTGA
jgi:hypothetical protein